MRIRKATKKDLNEISKLFLAETAKKPYQQPWNKKTSLQKINEFFKEGDIYIVLEQNEIIGFIVLIIHLGSKGKSVHVEELWLKSECQNKGIGRKVMEFVEKKYKKQGVRNISLVSDKRSKAFGFYKKLKYESYPEYMLMGKKLEK
jgi:aminoglycoside 6'-N-acetyltransferase I